MAVLGQGAAQAPHQAPDLVLADASMPDVVIPEASAPEPASQTRSYRHPLNVPAGPRGLYASAVLLVLTCMVFAACAVSEYAVKAQISVVVVAVCLAFLAGAWAARAMALRMILEISSRPQDSSRTLPLIVGCIAHLLTAAILTLLADEAIGQGQRVGLVLGAFIGTGAFFVARGVWSLLRSGVLALLPLVLIDAMFTGALVSRASSAQYLRTSVEHAVVVAAALMISWLTWMVVRHLGQTFSAAVTRRSK